MITKKCNKCHKEKTIGNFYNTQNSCKECDEIATLHRIRTKRGLISRIYTDQKQTCKRRNHSQPEYTLDELLNFVMSHKNFNSLYDNWVKSGYKTLLRPSIDRKDDYVTYTIDNIQLMTFKDNIDKCAIDRKSCKNSKNCTGVIKLDLNGNEIKRYKSLRQASRDVCGNNTSDANIHMACSGKLNTAYGYKWKFNKQGYL